MITRLKYALIILTLLTSCDKEDIEFTGNTGYMTDPRDGRIYSWVKIGNEIWMAENLAFFPVQQDPLLNSQRVYVWGYYDKTAEDAAKHQAYHDYGCLYDGFMLHSDTICPPGWHVATDHEWKKLEKAFGLSDSEVNRMGFRDCPEVVKRMKSTKHWSEDQKGSDSLGFGLIPGGKYDPYHDRIPPFYKRDTAGYYASSDRASGFTELSLSHRKVVVRVFYDGSIDRYKTEREAAFSVRCVKH